MIYLYFYNFSFLLKLFNFKFQMSKQFGNKGTWDDFYTDHFADLSPEYLLNPKILLIPLPK